MKLILLRGAIFFGGALIVVLLENTGILNAVVTHPVGFVLYWAFNAALVGWLFLGVAPVVFRYMWRRRST